MSRIRQLISAEPNLTPILDMVFQLITFFMLVVSFKTATMDPNVQLPVLGSAQPSHPEAERNYVVLNIDATGVLRVFGEAFDLEEYLATEANMLRKAHPGGDAGDDELTAAAVIRADHATSFSDLNKVLTACKKHGFRNVILKVRDPEPNSHASEVRL
jgi:biopolymer transport protein ExbD